MQDLVICGSVVSILLVIFGFILAMRYMNYRETLALAEKGLVRPQRQATNGGKPALVWGIIIVAVGLALCLGLWPIGLVGYGANVYPLGFGPWMLFGLVPLFFGLALILIYVLTRDTKKPDQSPMETPLSIERQE